MGELLKLKLCGVFKSGESVLNHCCDCLYREQDGIGTETCFLLNSTHLTKKSNVKNAWLLKDL